MKINRKFSMLLLASALATVPAVGFSQGSKPGKGDSIKHDLKNAGHHTKDTGHAVKSGSTKAYDKTAAGTKKAYNKTKNTTKGAVEGGREGAKKPSPSHPR